MYPSLALLARIESVAAGSPIFYILTLGSWRIWNVFKVRSAFFQAKPAATKFHNRTLQPWRTPTWQVRCWCWRLCLELFGNSFLNVMMSPRSMIVSFFCLIAPRRFACVVYAMFAFYRHCLHVRQSLENIGKQKKAIHWTHPFPFFKMPKKKHHVASCCCATTIKECLFTWDFETKNLMQSE